MVLEKAWDRARRLVRTRGVLGTSRRAAEVLYRRLMIWRMPKHPFDREHRVETDGLLHAKKIRSGHPHDAQTTAYFGSQPSVVQEAFARWSGELQQARQGPEEFTFVDIGCGKGRVLMLASQFPFRRIIGLELSPKMAERARANLKRWAALPHLCEDISVTQGDVLEFPLPEEPVLVYLYHPFEEALFGRWVEALQPVLAQRTAPLYLLYVNPCFEEKLQNLPGVRLLWSGDVEFDPEERAAHLFGGTFERVSLYHLARIGTFDKPA